MTIKINNNIYIIEFKVDEKDALKQIKEKNYAQKYLDEDKNISKFEWENIDGSIRYIKKSK